MNRVRTRHSLLVRIEHWLFAVSGLLLVFSGIGFMPLYGRFYLNDLPGLAWVSDFSIQMQLHYVMAAIFSTCGVFHVMYHLRRNETAALPQRGDVLESLTTIKAMLLGQPEPPHGKFLAEQRLAYLAIALCSLILVGSGWLLSWKNAFPVTPDSLFIQVVTLTHLVATMLFMLLLGMHVAAFLTKPNRPLLASIVTGRVPSNYAAKRHPHWKEAK